MAELKQGEVTSYTLSPTEFEFGHAIGPRKEMAVRTIFNVLGPLTNPAGSPNQIIGVFGGELVEPLTHVLKGPSTNRRFSGWITHEG